LSSHLSLQQVKTALLDLLLPLRCLGCGREGDLICPSCRQFLPGRRLPICQRCGGTVSEGNLCRSCINYPLIIDGIRSVFLFQSTVRQSILQLKYRHLKAIAAPLSQLLAEYLGSHPLKGEVIIPVPLHPKRLRERGYNQASLLAKELSRLISWPVVEDTLIRVRDALPRQELEAPLNVAAMCKTPLSAIKGWRENKFCSWMMSVLPAPPWMPAP